MWCSNKCNLSNRIQSRTQIAFYLSENRQWHHIRDDMNHCAKQRPWISSTESRWISLLFNRIALLITITWRINITDTQNVWYFKHFRENQNLFWVFLCDIFLLYGLLLALDYKICSNLKNSIMAHKAKKIILWLHNKETLKK